MLKKVIPGKLAPLAPKVREQAAPWINDTISGALASVMIFLLSLVLFQLGFSDSPELSFELVSPYSLFESFKSLVLELSTYQDWVLLAAGVLLAVLAAGIAVVWWKRDEAVEAPGVRDRVLDEIGSRRTFTFVTVATLTVLGAFAYQQYLWHVALPIPRGALGFAITREASAASFQDEFADALYTQGQAQQVVVRELPVKFDARDTAKARALGKRLGARAVVIYRAEEKDGATQYVAYVVFTDPKIGYTVGGRPAAGSAPAGDVRAAAAQTQTVEIKEGVEVPALRTETLDHLVNAAAGMIAYDDDRSREAIKHLELAAPEAPDDPNTGIVNFYLGNAYRSDGQVTAATAAFQKVATFYETRIAAGERLGPQDELILVKTDLALGRLATGADDWDGALAWFQKAVDLREDLLARAEGLERPTDVHATYAQVYTEMADAYRFQEKSEDQNFWEGRAKEELDALAASADPNDPVPAVQESSARFVLGDCVGAQAAARRALTIDPTDDNARYNLAGTLAMQESQDEAEAEWQRLIEEDPNSIEAREQLAASLWKRAFDLSIGVYEPTYLERAEQLYREILTIDPTNLDAHEQLGDIAEWRATAAQSDLTALLTGDDVSYAVSSHLWQQDPVRLKAVMDAYAEAIRERRVLASELKPNDPATQVRLAETYEDRLALVFLRVYDLQQAGDTAGLTEAGKQIADDIAQVYEWTDKVLAEDSAAGRLERLRAWAARLNAVESEWSWAAYYTPTPDQAATDALAKRFGEEVEAAVAYVDVAPPVNQDEVSAAGDIYLEAATYAAAVSKDAERMGELLTKWQNLATSHTASMQKSTDHLVTRCAEERDKAAGDDLYAAGDYASAATKYEAALTTNPDHTPSLLNLGAARWKTDDLRGAIEVTTRATELQPSWPLGWWNLAFYRQLTGDVAGSEAAFGQYTTLVRAMPLRERMANLTSVISSMSELMEEDPTQGQVLLTIAQRLAPELDGLPAEAKETLQYPGLYAGLGEVYLYTGENAAAEAAMRRAIELDGHLPEARADLALVVTAQGRDVTAEIQAAIAETQDALWETSGVIGPAEVLTMMQGAVDRYLKVFPDRATAVEPLTKAIADEQTRVAAQG
ncbi:MAG: hypothetical protein QOJ59_2477 [Thermomicrobiales bacterium]|jgi:tetratricopeptide (TPR) repeat protein|nr:hypothetical protein [Thermomicrobiales bacterium]